jgi:CHAT domain-containing protein/Tfp pilus assembly protein PilF
MYVSALVAAVVLQTTGAELPIYHVVNAQASAEASLAEAKRLQDEGERHIDARGYNEAAQKLNRALDLRRTHLGPRHPDVAQTIASLATVAYRQGDYARAEPLFQEALQIREATLEANHPLVADSLTNVASMYLLRGDYVRPEPIYLRALTIYEALKAAGKVSAEVDALFADTLNNLGLLYQRRGDYARAETHYLKALEVREQAQGTEHASVAEAAANLGGLYYMSTQYDKAMRALTRALSIQEKLLPPNHPSLAVSSFNLAAVYFDQGDYARAEPLFERALKIDEQALPPQHPRIAIRLSGLAETLRLKEDYQRAEALYERAAAIRERSLGRSHPLFADVLIGRALLRQASGDSESAVELLARAADLREDTFGLVLTTGSEQAKRLYLQSLEDEADIAVSLHIASAPKSENAARLALENIVQRKGRSIDAMAAHTAALRSRLDEDGRTVLEQLSTAQGQLAGLVLRGVSTDAQTQSVERLRGDIARLEQEISGRSAEFRDTLAKAQLSEVQASLPDDSAMVEFVVYRPFFIKNPRRTAFGAPHYAAYVLTRQGIVASADLGETDTIDRMVGRYRAVLSKPNAPGWRTEANALYRQLLRPLQPALSKAGRVIISADGALNLIPFAALVDEDGRYLVEKQTISYMTSSRDLARIHRTADAKRDEAPVIIANPLFDAGTKTQPLTQTGAATSPADRNAQMQTLRFGVLPGTAQEATTIARLLRNARVYTGAGATETVLKQVNAPAILHIATHGFFLRGAASGATDTRGLKVASDTRPAGNPEDALLLSGLALAGANQRSSDGEDGILTALEASGLNLWGTRMVVLSACETGVGDARNGQGVYGLRRALTLAGAESQVMSLWQVSDTATRDLMIAYYQRLLSGEARADALRNVQLAFLKERARAHPFYWASFIQSGDWRRLFN